MKKLLYGVFLILPLGLFSQNNEVKEDNNRTEQIIKIHHKKHQTSVKATNIPKEREVQLIKYYNKLQNKKSEIAKPITDERLKQLKALYKTK